MNPGHYRLIDPTTLTTIRAFSVNIRPEESDLTRLTASGLDDHLGSERFRLADNLEQLEDDINAADFSQEIFPLLLVLVVVLFCGEHLVANRFYDSPAGTGH